MVGETLLPLAFIGFRQPAGGEFVIVPQTLNELVLPMIRP
jgi:hypothetical protein